MYKALFKHDLKNRKMLFILLYCCLMALLHIWSFSNDFGRYQRAKESKEELENSPATDFYATAYIRYFTEDDMDSALRGMREELGIWVVGFLCISAIFTAFTAVLADRNSGWDRFLRTLPVTATQRTNSLFLFHGAIYGFALVLSLGVAFLVGLFTVGLDFALSVCRVGFFVWLLAITADMLGELLMIPIGLRVQKEKAVYALIGSLVIFFAVAGPFLLSSYEKLENDAISTLQYLALLACSAAIHGGAYLLIRHAYQKKYE
ncbi:MAG: ABC-2 transporter permease [Lachnospiraceae bacterium]|nr:ABC-2 transporter permease [Lachnospiraceae bacterium]